MKKQSFYHPKFTLTWILIGLMKLGAKLPFHVQIFLGKVAGKLLYLLLGKFRKIAFINISHCFVKKNKSEVTSLVKQNFESIGIALFETANAYFATDRKIENLTTVIDEHYLLDALAKKRNIILLSAHFMPLMMGGRALLLRHQIANVYRPQNNLLFDQFMRQAYENRGAKMIKTKDMRGVIKAIKSKIPVWYAPDQDLGVKNSVFAPFFNIQTATVSTTARLANIANTVVIPYFFIRTAQGYQMNFKPPLASYPSADEIANASQTNQILQAQILKNPEQYLWIHRRFKTRPDGEPSFY